MSSVVESPSVSSSGPEAKRRKVDSGIREISFPCEHDIVIKGICSICKKQMPESFSRAFKYIGEDFRISYEAIPVVRQYFSKVCFNQKKLHLVLDLDHTLIHTRRVANLNNNEKYLIEEAYSRKDLWRVTLADHHEYLIKFRPFVAEFLSKANELFEIYLYTNGSPAYAEAAVSLLDPQDIYFRHRVITREDSPRFKTLDLVLAEEHGVVIVDDKPKFWPDHQRNLITIVKYSFYHEKAEGNMGLKSYSEEKTDEREIDGPLAGILKFLEEVHGKFFEDETGSRDVRLLI